MNWDNTREKALSLKEWCLKTDLNDVLFPVILIQIGLIILDIQALAAIPFLVFLTFTIVKISILEGKYKRNNRPDIDKDEAMEAWVNVMIGAISENPESAEKIHKYFWVDHSDKLPIYDRNYGRNMLEIIRSISKQDRAIPKSDIEKLHQLSEELVSMRQNRAASN